MSKVFVYAYHKVLPKKSFDLSWKLFAFHLKVFKKFFHILSWEEFKAYLNGDFVPKKPSVLITFDDGYVDNYIFAYPLLKKYRAKAVLFVTASRIWDKALKRKTLRDYWEGKVALKELYKSKPMWESQKEFFQKGYSEDFLTWEELYEMTEVFHIGSHGISHSQGFISESITEFVTEENIDRIYSLWNIYKPPKIGYPIFERKSDLVAPVGRVRKEILTFCENFPKKANWEKLLKKELKRNFHHFLDFENEGEYIRRVEDDLKHSKEILEMNLNLKVEAFAYPWGDYSEKLLPLVGKYYNYAFTVEKENVTPEVNKLLIPRVYANKDIFTFVGHIFRYLY
jgi:peptidoglycan/xylan/chitin deacetylase (PgdA/CDA1 family)